MRQKVISIRLYASLTRKRVCLGFPDGTSGKEPTCQWRRQKRHRLDPWVGKIPWRRAWQPAPVSLEESPWIEEAGRLQSMESQRVNLAEATEHTRKVCVTFPVSCSSSARILSEFLLRYSLHLHFSVVKHWYYTESCLCGDKV